METDLLAYGVYICTVLVFELFHVCQVNPKKKTIASSTVPLIIFFVRKGRLARSVLPMYFQQEIRP